MLRAVSSAPRGEAVAARDLEPTRDLPKEGPAQVSDTAAPMLSWVGDDRVVEGSLVARRARPLRPAPAWPQCA